jgi:hypothetical protein
MIQGDLLPKLLYDKTETAQILGVRSVDWLVRTGKLPHRKVGKYIKFTLDDIQRFIDNAKTAS